MVVSTGTLVVSSGSGSGVTGLLPQATHVPKVSNMTSSFFTFEPFRKSSYLMQFDEVLVRDGLLFEFHHALESLVEFVLQAALIDGAGLVLVLEHIGGELLEILVLDMSEAVLHELHACQPVGL